MIDDQLDLDIGSAAVHLIKAGGDAKSYALSGRLCLSKSGWLLLDVPNALVRGAFDALDSPGAELPLNEGAFNAHISVMSPDELASVGGADKITERGHSYTWSISGLREAEPKGWPEMSRVWFLSIDSPDLKKLRASYGLSPEPDVPFHVTIAVRKRNVLSGNGVAKGAAHVAPLPPLPIEYFFDPDPDVFDIPPLEAPARCQGTWNRLSGR